MDLSNAHTLDFETTGVDAKTCHPVEVAVVNSVGRWDTFISLPEGVTIPAEASAVHHIIETDLTGAPSWESVKEQLACRVTNPPGHPLAILVAHNAEYERNVLGDFVPVLWICTYKCALRVWPDAPAHRNEVLRYHLRLGDNRGRYSDQRPHSALHDAEVTFLLLQELLKHATVEQLVEWTELPAKLPKMPMGKHYGMKWEEVPAQYLQWCVNQTDMREDVKYCAAEELRRRRGR